MKNSIISIVILIGFLSCHSQNKESVIVGGPCEGCEAVHEFGDKLLTPVDTLPLFAENEPKIKIRGTVYQKDGKTPAENVIVYIYQTNRKGIYQRKGNEKGWARRHGFIRGWVKTAKDGGYTFYTFRPAAYPSRNVHEHIHITVKEPDKNEYYLDDFVFEDDPLLTQSQRNGLRNRGGSGISSPVLKDGILTIDRDLILGLNIPNYD